MGINFILPTRVRNPWLLSVSLFFYSWGETFLVGILVLSIAVNYVCGLLIADGFSRNPIRLLDKNEPKSITQKIGLVTSITANLGLLVFYKYFNFGVDSLNRILSSVGLEQLQWNTALVVTLPLGVSFFTFQSMSYTIDIYLGNTKATRNLLDFATYVCLFPQLVAGPIVRYSQVAKELVKRTVSSDNMARGIRRFVVGLGKKMIIANVVALPADQIFALPNSEITTSLAWFAVACYTLQIYFDFSGYSDMALGMGLMLGFHYPENFNFPYVAQSIREFWRRWHLSLSTWFRDYLYIPLGGNKKGTGRTYFNLLSVFFLCGLWHGASWTFVVWGLYHGMFLVLERTGLGRVIDRAYRPLRHIYTLLVVMIGWLIFRAESFAQALTFLKSMFGFGLGRGIKHNIPMYWSSELALVLLLGIIGSMPWASALDRRLSHGFHNMVPAVGRSLDVFRHAVVVAFLGVVFTYSAMLLSAQTHNPFIYFRF